MLVNGVPSISAVKTLIYGGSGVGVGATSSVGVCFFFLQATKNVVDVKRQNREIINKLIFIFKSIKI